MAYGLSFPIIDPVSFYRGLRLCFREMRRGFNAMIYLFIFCLLLSTSAISTISTVSNSIDAGFIEEGGILLGGDIELSILHRGATEEESLHMQDIGLVSDIAVLRMMAYHLGNEGLTFVELKSVDDSYPLYGRVELDPPISLQDALSFGEDYPGVVVDPLFLQRSNATIGDVIELGDIEFKIIAVIKKEPDKLSGGISLGPRVMVNQKFIEKSSIFQEGSLIRRYYRIALDSFSSSKNIDVLTEELQLHFEQEGWRIKNRQNPAPSARNFFSRMSYFLTLVSLSTLLIAGVGVATATHYFVDMKRRNIAILKCLGAPVNRVFQIYLTQILLLALIGIFLGSIVSILFPFILDIFLHDILPFPLRPGAYGDSFLLSFLCGLLTTLGFCVVPLAKAAIYTKPTELFRGNDVTSDHSIGDFSSVLVPYYLIAGICLFSLYPLVLFYFGNFYFTTIFFTSIVICAIFLRLVSSYMRILFERVPKSHRISLHMALSNLHRPGTLIHSIILVFGTTLSVFITIAFVSVNLSHALKDYIPENAPTFFFIDVQTEQLNDFRSFLNEYADSIKNVPMLRGRVIRVKGLDVENVEPAPDAAWVLNGDRGVTYSADIPVNSRLVSGEWWDDDYEGPPLVSLVDEIAEGLGLSIGDTIDVSIFGETIHARIANLRSVEWQSLDINFVMVFSPNALRDKPHMHIVTANTFGSAEDDYIFSHMQRHFPNVTVIRVKEAFEILADVVEKSILAIEVTSIITFIIGVLVISGSMATTLRQKTHDCAIMRTLGALKEQLVMGYFFEYMILGFIAVLFSAFIGMIASRMILTEIMNIGWNFYLTALLPPTIIAFILSIMIGFLTNWRALSAQPAKILRVH